MTKYDRKRREANFLIITTLLILLLKYIFGGQFPIRYGEIIYLIAIAGLLFFLFILTRGRYSNMSTFFILTFLLIGLLPYFHYLNYSYNKENYSFNNEYLHKNIHSYKDELKKYKDSVFISELKFKLYNRKLNLLLENKKQKISDYTFVVKSISEKGAATPNQGPIGRPNDRGNLEKEVDIFKIDKKIITLKLGTGNLIDGIDQYIKEINLLNTKIQNPKQFIPYNDIWLDSVTGFVFGFIKPLSKLSQIIRLLQLINAYFLFHMISSWLKISKKLNISEIDNKIPAP
ncbi:hypothetical protein [Flavobacterium sp. SORGH_AS_0622]|uniref:hypothetical protein n=1 Tax=Flavobacterium sp. SORGH_AS_0622 TaxID=3041772 RepID=UPI00277E1703|nr:hypothetical protein [Flavobacterium sp. SORGH_AS_0622]MDQ1164879.1 hypothetical protein [Flavobacterium sp. SORGH_AS_0622]